MTTQYGPGDPETWSKQPDDNTVDRHPCQQLHGGTGSGIREPECVPTEPLTDDFVAKVWAKLVDNSPAIDKFILAYLDKPNIGYHNWSSVIQEIADAVDEALYGKAS